VVLVLTTLGPSALLCKKNTGPQEVVTINSAKKPFTQRHKVKTQRHKDRCRPFVPLCEKNYSLELDFLETDGAAEGCDGDGGVSGPADSGDAA